MKIVRVGRTFRLPHSLTAITPNTAEGNSADHSKLMILQKLQLKTHPAASIGRGFVSTISARVLAGSDPPIGFATQFEGEKLNHCRNSALKMSKRTGKKSKKNITDQ
jgi:hypothetical protein